MSRWCDLERDEPELGTAGRQLLYQFGPGLAFLATVRPDGGPRMHPICPVIAEGGLYAFIVESPKLGDLRRDGRYALHTFPPEHTDDEFYLTGAVTEISDRELRTSVASACLHSISGDDALFEFHIARCLHAKYRERGAFPPTYTRWAAPDAGRLR